MSANNMKSSGEVKDSSASNAPVSDTPPNNNKPDTKTSKTNTSKSKEDIQFRASNKITNTNKIDYFTNVKDAEKRKEEARRNFKLLLEEEKYNEKLAKKHANETVKEREERLKREAKRREQLKKKIARDEWVRSHKKLLISFAVILVLVIGGGLAALFVPKLIDANNKPNQPVATHPTEEGKVGTDLQKAQQVAIQDFEESIYPLYTEEDANNLADENGDSIEKLKQANQKAQELIEKQTEDRYVFAYTIQYASWASRRNALPDSEIIALYKKAEQMASTPEEKYHVYMPLKAYYDSQDNAVEAEKYTKLLLQNNYQPEEFGM